MAIERLIAAWADGDADIIPAMTTDEIRAVLDEIDPIQREGERQIQRNAADRRAATGGRIDHLLREHGRMVAEQQQRATLRRALKRELATRSIDYRPECARLLAGTLATVEASLARLNAGLETADGLTDEEIDDVLQSADDALAALDGQLPDWRELAGAP